MICYLTSAVPYDGLQAAVGTHTSNCLALFGYRQQENNFVNTVQSVHSQSEVLKVLYKSLCSQACGFVLSVTVCQQGPRGLCHTSRQQIPANVWAQSSPENNGYTVTKLRHPSSGLWRGNIQ